MINFITILRPLNLSGVVPGDGFGAPGHIRFSYAVSSDTIKKGMNKLRLALNKLTK